MPRTISAMFLFLALLLFVIGILIKYYKCYWLISGYNIASKEEKAKVDIEGLGKHAANFSFIMAGIFALSAVFVYFKQTVALFIVIGLLLILVPYEVIKIQKFNSSNRTDKTRARLTIIVVIAVTVLTAAFIGGIYFYGGRDTKITVSETTISITGPYSINYLIKDIESVELKDSIPNILGKMDGYDMGILKKGNFKLEGIGGARLYINGSEPPYIYLKKADKYIIINLKNREDTQDLYFKLKSAIDKSKMA